MTELRAIALMSARNEADIISQVLEHLIQNGVQVFLIDDDSTDDTVGEASRWFGRGLLEIEHRSGSAIFDWTAILQRKEVLATELDADWFLHHDADEFRESPWPNRPLLEAIKTVDDLGYNAIDFRVLNFPPTHDRFARGMDIREEFRHFEPAPSWDAFQIKAWKRGPVRVDLVSSGGHDAVFSDRRVCPIQFLNRHYPIRSQAHGRHKVFTDRQPRFSPVEVAKGWHVQYQRHRSDTNFIRDPSALRPFNMNEVRSELLTTGRDAFLRLIDAERADRDRQALEAQRVSAEAAHQDTEAQRVAAESGRQSAEAALRAVRSECDRLALHAQELERALRAAETDLQKRGDDIARLQQDVAKWHHLLEAEQADAAAKVDAAARAVTAARADTAAQQDAAERHIERLRGELQRAIADLESLYQSTSWRITRPLRRAYEMFNSSATRNPADRRRSDGG